jgi:ribonuclease BN (tRNA processing enzyme)
MAGPYKRCLPVPGDDCGTTHVRETLFLSMAVSGERIRKTVGSWEGVTAHPHRFGGVEFRLGRVELGHLHGDHLADLPFPMATHDALLAQGRAEPHHVLPRSGWVSRRIETRADVDDVIELFRLNFDRMSRRRGGRAEPDRSSTDDVVGQHP